MRIFGIESVTTMLESEHYLFKLIANDAGVVVFPHTTEHRDAPQPGIRSADDSAGDALAAMVKPGSIEFRFHRQFPDERVRVLATKLLALPELDFARSFTVTYQARTIIDGSG